MRNQPAPAPRVSWQSCVVAMALAALAPRFAAATEGGGTSKALGVDTVLSGVMPPPGMQLTTFLAYYEANETLDGNGDPRPGISNFNVRAEAATLRFRYVWPDAKVWGADIETRIGFTAYTHANVQFDVTTPGGQVHRQGSTRGTGDALLGPALLGWHSDRVHQIVGLEFWIPSGTFNPVQLANAGRGYWTTGPAYWITWFPVDEVEADFTIVYL